MCSLLPSGPRFAPEGRHKGSSPGQRMPTMHGVTVQGFALVTSACHMVVHVQRLTDVGACSG